MMSTKKTEVIGVASGKGGVGKTTVSINLATALTLQGHKVMLFDADLGLANAQIALGARATYNLSHVLNGEKTLSEIMVTTKQGIMLIPDASVLELSPGSAAARDFRRLADVCTQFRPVDNTSGGLQFFMERQVNPSQKSL